MLKADIRALYDTRGLPRPDVFSTRTEASLDEASRVQPRVIIAASPGEDADLQVIMKLKREAPAAVLLLMVSSGISDERALSANQAGAWGICHVDDTRLVSEYVFAILSPAQRPLPTRSGRVVESIEGGDSSGDLGRH